MKLFTFREFALQKKMRDRYPEETSVVDATADLREIHGDSSAVKPQVTRFSLSLLTKGDERDVSFTTKVSKESRRQG